MGILLWASFAWYTHNTLEDALITFRYAQNIVQGHGFAFNSGERVLGTTTPLLTLLLALGGLLLGVPSIPLIATYAMGTAGLAAGVVVAATLLRSGFPITCAAFFAFVFYSWPGSIVFATGGMETPLVFLLMATSLYLLVAKRYLACSIALALLVLARIDGLIWCLSVFSALFLGRRKFPLRELGVFGLTLLPWVAFSFWYFGSPVPNSLIAKEIIRSSADQGSIASFSYFHSYWMWFLTATGLSILGLAYGLWAIAIAIGTSVVANRHWSLWPLVIFPPAYWAALLIGRAPSSFDWYMVPLTWCVLVLGSIGAATVNETVLRKYFQQQGRSRILAATVASVLIGVCAFELATSDLSTFVHYHDLQLDEDGLRRKVGEYLRDNTAPDASVAMEAVGYEGYYSQRKVIDLAGLNSPAVVDINRKAASNADAFQEVLLQLKPTYIVLRSWEVDLNLHFQGGALFESPDQRSLFFSLYEERARFHQPNWVLENGRGSLTIYAMK